MEVAGVRQHTPDVKSVQLRFRDAERASRFDFRVGQFGIFSAFGAGESTFNICSSSNWHDRIDSASASRAASPMPCGAPRRATRSASAALMATATRWKSGAGTNLIFLGGGIAMPPIRCAIWYALENRADYGEITIVYGARTVGDLVFVDELDRWARHPGVRVIRCVDPGGQTPDWDGEIGFVPTVFERAAVPAGNAVALVIGPPIMIKNTIPVLERMGAARSGSTPAWRTA